MEYARLVVADEVQTMLGNVAVKSIARCRGAVDDCGTFGNQLGGGRLSLVAYGVREDVVGDTSGDDRLVEVIAHHAECQTSAWHKVASLTSPSPTYRAQAFSLPVIGVPDPDDPEIQRLHSTLGSVGCVGVSGAAVSGALLCARHPVA